MATPFYLFSSDLTSDPHRCSPPLLYSPSPNHSKEASPRRASRTTLPPPRREPPLQRLRHITLLLRLTQSLPRVRVQRRDFPQGSGEQRQTGREPDDRSCGNGGYDGHDEGKHGYDGPANTDHGVDQCLFFGLRRLSVVPSPCIRLEDVDDSSVSINPVASLVVSMVQR